MTRLCKHCKKDNVKYIKEHEPWYTDGWMCPSCDSEYAPDDYLPSGPTYNFHGKEVYYKEYGAGAEIINRYWEVIADFPCHLDAEKFLKGLEKCLRKSGTS